MQEEIFYYSFAEGDQLILNFQEIDKKELKEIEILEYPANSKFMEYKTKKIENKTINISRTGVYVFRLSNGGLLGRVCKIKIDRVPASDKTKLFNSAVRWVEKPDTTWNIYNKEVIVGYDTLLIPRTQKELVKTDISEDLFMVKDEQVHSRTNANGNKNTIFFTVPTYPSTEFIRKKITSLSYWIGVGEEANKQWEKNTKVIKGLAQGVAGFFVSPLGAYAVGAIANLALPSNGEHVYYAIVDEQGKNLFYAGAPYTIYDEGSGIAGYKKFTDYFLLRGTWYIVLRNDNYMQGINVRVKISVMVQTDYYLEKPYTEQKITARYENKTFKAPIVKFIKVPVCIN